MEVDDLKCDTRKIIFKCEWHITGDWDTDTGKNHMRVNRLFWRFDSWKVKLSGNSSVSKSIRLETSGDSSFFLQAGVLSILHLFFARTDGLPGGLMGGVNDFKGGSLTEFDVADVEGL